MSDLTDEEIEAANERGRIVFETEPHARAVRYDIKSKMIIVDLYNDCTFAFPPRQLQGLENATDAQLAEVETSGMGYGLHWEALDADFTVGGLMQGRFGSRAYMERQRAKLRSILNEAERNPRPHAA